MRVGNRSRLEKMFKKKLPLLCAFIIGAFVIIALSAQFFGLASNWDQPVGSQYLAPSSASITLWFGTDILGRSVLMKTIQGARVALSIGVITAFLSAPIGVLLGCLAGYFGGWVDHLIVWFITTLSSIPSILLLIAISYTLGRGMSAVYIALTATSWIALARILRGEVLKHKQKEYLLAAESIGVGHGKRIFKHLLPNIAHQIIISMTFMVEVAIRSEVLLSYLGLGVQNLPSWGKMMDDAKGELSSGIGWQLTAAALSMFFLMFAINVFGDYLRDALDPKAQV